MKVLRIATVCMHARPHDMEGNLSRMESFAREASEKEVDVLCFPELSISGYILKDAQKVYPRAFTREILERTVGLSRKNRLVIIAGMIEVTEEEKPYISQIVAGPEGILGIYRKTHLSPQERACYGAGRKIEVFRYRDFVFGVQLCYEAHFPEISTVMALRGAEVIFMPHASPRGTPEEKLRSWLRHLPARAFDNGLFIAACNQGGKTEQGLVFPGIALVLDPAGRIVVQYTENREELVLTDLDRDMIQQIRGHRMRYFLPHRRPDLYAEISASSLCRDRGQPPA